MNKQPISFLPGMLHSGALGIAGVYLILGSAWILFSDRVAARIALNEEMLVTISLYKGWGYVLVTALLLYWLIRRHTAALGASEAQLHRVIDALPALISYVGANRRYQFANSAYAEWFEGDILGKHVEEVIGTSAYRSISKYMDKVLGGETVRYETEVSLPDGERYVSAVYVPDIGANKQVKGYFALIHDVTEQKQAEEEQRLWADAFEGCAHGIAISDPNTNRIAVCNPAFANMHKCRVENIVGSGILSLYASADHERVRRNIEKADQIGHARFEARMTRRGKGHSTFPVQMDVVSVLGQDGEVLHRVVTAQDISERRQAEKVLQESEERYRIVSELTSDYAYKDRVEADGSIIPEWITESFTRITGYTVEETQTPEFWQRLIHPEDVPALLQHTQKILAGQSDTQQMRVITKSGEVRCLRDFANPVWDPAQNRVVSLYGAVQDITERRQAEAALQKAHDELELKVQERTAALSEANTLLQALMEYMPDQIYFKDMQSRFIRNSRSQANLLGLSNPTQVVGKTDFDFFPHAARAYAEEQEIIRSGKSLVDFEEWVVWPDGREMWVSTTKVPLRNSDGETIGIFGISRDITERKRTEQAIRQLNADLEGQAEKLQAANKELEAFSYSVSHDLRAPLRAIDGYTRILVEGYESILDHEGKRICGVISREAHRMGQLIDDLLAFSRLGRKEMYSSKIQMKTLVVSVLNELTKEENQERLDIQIARVPAVRGDSSLIRQVWVNLLSNAIKFTSKKERAVIEIGSKTSGDEILYYVRDNGAGFDMEYGNKLFGVFQRLHSESEFRGTGVGLAIVQRIIRRHGGHVWAIGEVEKGATFYFALPRKENLS